MKFPGRSTPAREEDLDTRAILSSVITGQRKIIVGLTAATAALAVGYIFLLPLKENTPYVLERNPQTGEIKVPPQQEAMKFTPAEDNILFFIRRFLLAQWAIQPQLSRDNEALVLSTLRGDVAINKHKAFRTTDNTYGRLASEPTLVRDVVVDSIVPVAGAQRAVVANITLTTTSRGETKVEKRLVTVFYDLFPPMTRKDREDHPIGLYVVDFRIAEN